MAVETCFKIKVAPQNIVKNVSQIQYKIYVKRCINYTTELFAVSRIELRLQKLVVLEQGQRFTLRDGFCTVGTGVVTKILPALTEAERQGLLESKKQREKREAVVAKA